VLIHCGDFDPSAQKGVECWRLLSIKHTCIGLCRHARLTLGLTHALPVSNMSSVKCSI